MGDRIRVFIHDCRVDLPIGMYGHEKNGPQPVIINLECEGALTRRYDDIGDHSLAHVIDYAPFYRFLRETLPQIGHIYLLESLAEKIADFCFKDARIESVKVRIEKTRVFADAAGGGIDFFRARP